LNSSIVFTHGRKCVMMPYEPAIQSVLEAACVACNTAACRAAVLRFAGCTPCLVAPNADGASAISMTVAMKRPFQHGNDLADCPNMMPSYIGCCNEQIGREDRSLPAQYRVDASAR